MRLLLSVFTKYADFTGRAGRVEFWMFFGLFMVASLIANQIDLGGASAAPIFLRFGMVELIVFLILLLPLLTVGTRRLHDSGRSGWWMLLMYVPYLGWSVAIDGTPAEMLSLGGVAVGFIALMIMFALPGDKAVNQYGAPPSVEVGIAR